MNHGYQPRRVNGDILQPPNQGSGGRKPANGYCYFAAMDENGNLVLSDQMDGRDGVCEFKSCYIAGIGPGIAYTDANGKMIVKQIKKFLSFHL